MRCSHGGTNQVARYGWRRVNKLGERITMKNHREITQGRLSALVLFLLVLCASFVHAFGVENEKPTVPVQSSVNSENIEETQVLQLRGDSNYPPFEYLNEQRQPVGFNVDIIHAVAKAMGLKIKIDLGPWDEVMSQLEQGKIDALIGMFQTKERDKKVDFSIPHFVASYAVFVRNDSTIQSLADAKDKNIIVQLSDLGHDFVKEQGITSHIITKKDWSEVLQSLANGEGDCAIVSRLQGTRLISKIGITNIKAVGPPIIQRKYCLAVTEGNTALLAKLNEGLSIIKDSGKFDEIYKKWFGVYEEQSFSLVSVFKYFIWIILPLLALTIVGFLWSWSLKKQVSIRTIALHNELFERERAEEALRKNEVKHQAMVANIGDVIAIIDQDGINKYKSPNIEKWFGWRPEDVVGISTWEKIHPEDLGRCQQFFNSLLGEPEATRTAEFQYRCKDGSYKWIELSAVNLILDPVIKGVLLNYHDITERKSSEEKSTKLRAQLQQAQKMESVGQLAGGVAHDFNNMLGVILGHAELAQQQTNPIQPIFAHLLEIRKAAQRSSDITRQLLAFARKQTVAPKVLDLNETIENMLKMLRRLIGEDIDLVWLPGSSLWQIKMDPSQIDQILANLCVNARDAIAGVGKITVETGNSAFDEQYCSVHAGFVPGEYVRIVVSDNGRGMDKETLVHIFEPFFTTKGIGKGTGLGLATVYGAVKQNNGFLNAYSELGHGSTFTIYLPRHTGTTEHVQRDEEEPVAGGHETILLVEDEPTILEITQMMLQSLGYTIMTANTPEEAINLVGGVIGEVHLLLTDVMMPAMNGWDLAQRLLISQPEMKCLFMSGYTANIITYQGVLNEKIHFLQKPFSQRDLAVKVREALENA